jgi:pyruvate dehydrogenase E1 component alpha subunit
MDCLKNFRARVTAEGWLADADLDRIDAEVLELIDRSVAAARTAAPPAPADLLTDVYVSY